MGLQGADSINTFFALLRSGMYGTPLPVSSLPEDIDWESVITLARKHVVFGIIIDSIQFLPERLRPSDTVYAKMNRFALGLIQTNMVLDRTVARLVAFFRQHGIDGVLLKGQGVARYYRMPQMRQSGDIDFYVGKTVYEKALRLCKEHLVGDSDPGDECEKHFGFNMSGVHVELHRLAARMYSPFRNRRFQNWIVGQLEHSPDRRVLPLGDTDVILPSYDFDAIYIFYHAWHHYLTGGIGLRQLCDWAMIFHTHAADIDVAALEENIRRLGLTRGWKLFACIAVGYLGVPADKMPLYDPAYDDKSEKILKEILVGGNFGYYSAANAPLMVQGTGFWDELGKVPAVTRYFLSLFPVIPFEATFLYFHRLFSGTMLSVKSAMRKKK